MPSGLPVVRRVMYVLLAALALAITSVSPAAARNVPGSASVAQTAIDQAVGSSILDSLLIAPTCDYLDKSVGKRREEPCTTGFSIGGGVVGLQDAPDGYKFDYSAAYSTMIISQRLSGNAVIFGGLIGEAGSGVLEYNDGTLTHYGVGAAAGATFDLNESARFAVVGSAEWLNYSTTRSNGLYEGSYDAARFMADARLSGILEGDWFFFEYGGDLRLIHQVNAAYTEYSLDTPFAEVDETTFTSLTAIGNLKLGIPMGGSVTPYVEATGYLGLYQDGDMNTVGIEDRLTGRVGVGLNAEVADGLLSLRTGTYFDGGGYKGYDASVNFAKPF